MDTFFIEEVNEDYLIRWYGANALLNFNGPAAPK